MKHFQIKLASSNFMYIDPRDNVYDIEFHYPTCASKWNKQLKLWSYYYDKKSFKIKVCESCLILDIYGDSYQEQIRIIPW